jgi:hypothetical protein
LSSLWNAQRVIMVKVHVARMRKESVLIFDRNFSM